MGEQRSTRDEPIVVVAEAAAADASAKPAIDTATGTERPIASGTGPLQERADSERGAPVRLRELVAVVGLVAAADVTIYHGHGFAGYAALFVAAPLLLLLGAQRATIGGGVESGLPRETGRPTERACPRFVVGILGLMLLAAAGRLVWCGNGLLTAAGFLLLPAFAMAVAGLRPYVLDVIVYVFQSIIAGLAGLWHYGRSPSQMSSRSGRAAWLSWAMPLAALLGFGTIFVLANPDVASLVSERLERAFRWLREQYLQLAPGWQQVLFWIAVAWISAGLLRPVVRKSVLNAFSKGRHEDTAERAETPLYGAFRNTLVTVIALFAVYLVFEFKTLWFRDFPEGFYYAGYAHEGAAWLTAALALATVVLSLIFRPSLFGDPRLPRLRRLAWAWSAENMLLALAVYNRLFIYIGFNGMTRMRTVGLFGISAVVVGFVLVVRKITAGRDFVWLLRRHLWTLAVAVFLLALTPVDMIVHAYNVRRILAGDPAPSVQISVHPIDTAGILVLPPLLESDDEVIREGVRAMLAARAVQVKAAERERREAGWTSFQLADRVLLDRLDDIRANWEKYADPEKRTAALQRFHDYAYQWY